MSPQEQTQLLNDLRTLATIEQSKARQYRTRAAQTAETFPSDSRHYDALAETHEELSQELREIIMRHNWS